MLYFYRGFHPSLLLDFQLVIPVKPYGWNPLFKIFLKKIILNTKETKIDVLINVSINVQLMLQEKALRLNINYDTN